GSVSIDQEHQSDMSIEGELDTGFVEKVNPEWKGSGPAKLNVVVHGSLAHPDIKGNLSASNVTLTHLADQKVLSIAKAEANFTGSKVEVKGEASYNETNLTVDASIPFDKTDGRIRLEIPALSLQQWMPPDSKVSGTLNVVADFQGKGLPVQESKNPKFVPPTDWSGKLTVAPTGLKVGEKEIQADAPLELIYRNGVVLLNPSHLSSGEMLDFKASGNYNLETGALDTQLKANAKIDFLS